MADIDSFISVVSGLPRSGTSMMMQMLDAGGIPPVTDRLRTPDEDNPKGYYEYEPVKQLKKDKRWLGDAVGKAVKVIHLHLYDLDLSHRYRVVFMQRAIEEVLASQREMLKRRGQTGAEVSDEKLAGLFQVQLKKVTNWLAQQENVSVLYVSYNELLASPEREVARVSFFFDGLDTDAMLGIVDPGLYRQREPGHELP